eukprot:m.61911 g.61911  ORF g.61911 m.61911 type:complete len:222 (-) comp11464_c0_seq1:49-714(-)
MSGRVVSVMLGSSSKFKQGLAAQAMPDPVHTVSFNLHPKFVSPDIDEKAVRRADPQEMVLAIAQAKMDKLLELLDPKNGDSLGNPDLVIAADEIILFGDTVREKPEDEKQAKEFLQSYGKEKVPAICLNGVVVANVKSGVRSFGVDKSVQYFECVPDDVVQKLIDKGDVMYCAGGFTVEDPLLEPYLGKREGEIEAIQGMPIQLTKQLILERSQEIIKQAS